MFSRFDAERRVSGGGRWRVREGERMRVDGEDAAYVTGVRCLFPRLAVRICAFSSRVRSSRSLLFICFLQRSSRLSQLSRPL
jgi:hypothetical protein